MDELSLYVFLGGLKELLPEKYPFLPQPWSFFIGEEIQYRCTEKTETVCKPCQDGYYKTEYSEGDCKTCKICNLSKSAVASYKLLLIERFFYKG